MWIRMQVRFHANDNEPLARDLARYDKGQRRIARLLTLATYGLVYLRRAVRDENASAMSYQDALVRADDDGIKPTLRPDSYDYKMTAGDIGDVFGD